MAITKILNKVHGYHCDKCRVVPKVIFSNNEGFLCKDHAVSTYGAEAVANATIEEE